MLKSRLGFLMGGLLAGVAAMVIWKVRDSDGSWQAYRKELVAKGEILEWAKLQASPVAPGENVLEAERFLVPAAIRLRDLPLWSINTKKMRPWAGDGIRITDYFAGGLAMNKGIESLHRVRAATIEEVSRSLTDYFERTDKRIKAIRFALHRPHCQLVGSFHATEPILDLRRASASFEREMLQLSVHGHFQLHRQMLDEAFLSCRATWQLVEHARSLPALEGVSASRSLCRAALPLLAAGLRDQAWNEAQLKELLQLLPEPYDEMWLMKRLKEERALYVSTAERCRDVDQPESMGGLRMDPEILAVPYQWTSADMLNYCELLDEAFFHAFEAREEQGFFYLSSCLIPLADFKKRHPFNEERHFLTGKLTPLEQLSGFVVPPLMTFADKSEPPIEIELARVAIMLEIFKLKNRRYPRDWEELGITRPDLGYKEIDFLVKADGTPQVHAHGHRNRRVALERIKRSSDVWQYTTSLE